MKATLEFNLPEDRTEHRAAINGTRLGAEVVHADSQMRSWMKHGHTFASPDEAIEACRKLLSDAVELAIQDE